MNRTIAQILHVYFLDKDQEHWPDYVAMTEMAINSTLYASINKVPFEVFYGENILFPIDLLLVRELLINPHAHTSARKMK